MPENGVVFENRRGNLWKVMKIMKKQPKIELCSWIKTKIYDKSIKSLKIELVEKRGRKIVPTKERRNEEKRKNIWKLKN